MKLSNLLSHLKARAAERLNKIKEKINNKNEVKGTVSEVLEKTNEDELQLIKIVDSEPLEKDDNPGTVQPEIIIVSNSKEEVNLLDFIDNSGNLSTKIKIKNFDDHIPSLLSNFFNEAGGTSEVTGSSRYGLEQHEYYAICELNDFGKQIAGEDGVISKEELMQLDMDGDGKITQDDIDKYKAKLDKEKYSTKDLTESLLSSLDEDGFLATGGGHVLTEENEALFKKEYGELTQFFERKVSYDFSGGVRYCLNEYGRELAGADGKISKKELMKLDLNNDGKITQKEIDTFKANLDKKKASDMYTFLNSDGNLPKVKSYYSESEQEHDSLLLKNLYEKIGNDIFDSTFKFMEQHATVDGVDIDNTHTNYKLNDFGKELAGSDGVISKEELMQLDMDGDGKITQDDIDKYKAKLDKEKYSTKDLTESLLSSLDEDGFLATGGGCAVCPAGFEAFEKKYGELKQFFESLPNYGRVGSSSYRLDEYGRALAGADGKISKEELMQLDMNGDGKITQEDIDKFKADLDKKKASDLYTYIDCSPEGKLSNIRSYLSTNEVQHEQLLLSNLYDEITKDDLTDQSGMTSIYADGTIVGTVDGVRLDSAHKNYKLNEFGKAIAGEDGVISKEELMKLDMDGDGKITQDDIDKYKAQKDNPKPLEGYKYISNIEKFDGGITTYTLTNGVKVTVDSNQKFAEEDNMYISDGILVVSGLTGGKIEGTKKNDKIILKDSVGVKIEGNDGNDRITVVNSKFVNVDGGKGDDIICTYDSAMMELNGGGGNDIVKGGPSPEVGIGYFEEMQDPFSMGQVSPRKDIRVYYTDN